MSQEGPGSKNIVKQVVEQVVGPAAKEKRAQYSNAKKNVSELIVDSRITNPDFQSEKLPKETKMELINSIAAVNDSELAGRTLQQVRLEKDERTPLMNVVLAHKDAEQAQRTLCTTFGHDSIALDSDERDALINVIIEDKGPFVSRFIRKALEVSELTQEQKERLQKASEEVSKN